MRHGHGPEALLLATALLVGAATATVLASGPDDPGRIARRAEALRLTGGLGLGSTVDPSTCRHGFDPRLEDACGRRHGPLVGDPVPCPSHAGLLPPPR